MQSTGQARAHSWHETHFRLPSSSDRSTGRPRKPRGTSSCCSGSSIVTVGLKKLRIVMPMPMRAVRSAFRKVNKPCHILLTPHFGRRAGPGGNQPRHSTYRPVQPRLMRASGMSTYQPRFIKWSIRMRGSVHPIHMVTKMTAYVLMKNQTMGGSNGPEGPPRKNVVARAENTIRLAYSARKNTAQRKPLYSVL